VTHDIEARDNSLVLLQVSNQNSRGRLEELNDLIDVFVGSDSGKRRFKESPDGKLHHLGRLHGPLEERALAQ